MRQGGLRDGGTPTQVTVLHTRSSEPTQTREGEAPVGRRNTQPGHGGGRMELGVPPRQQPRPAVAGWAPLELGPETKP